MSDFKMQIDEDIIIIQRDYGHVDPRLIDAEFAFNYWVLSRIYSLDEEVLSPNITEGNDKNIDCFVHYEDTKELYIIQNKYYDKSTVVNRNDVSDFLKTPLSVLHRRQYAKSKELQRIYSRVHTDSEYKIWLHFYVTNEYHSDDIDSLFNYFSYENEEVTAYVGAKYFDISEIRMKYFGERLTNKTRFTAIMPTRHAATSLDVRPEEYKLPWMIAFRENGFIAFTKGSSVLKPNSPLYKEFSLNIETWCTVDNMINLYLLHYKAENDKKNNDKRFPVPYYVMSFIGAVCKDCGYEELKAYLDYLFESKEIFLPIYNFYKMLTSVYARDYTSTKSTDYNVMIKQEIDLVMYEKNFHSALDMSSDAAKIRAFIEFM